MADIERKKNVRVQSSWNKIFLRSNVALVEKHHIDTHSGFGILLIMKVQL